MLCKKSLFTLCSRQAIQRHVVFCNITMFLSHRIKDLDMSRHHVVEEKYLLPKVNERDCKFLIFFP